MKLNKLTLVFFSLTATWYLMFFLIPYDIKIDQTNAIYFENGSYLPLLTAIMSLLIVGQIVTYVLMAVAGYKRKTYKPYWYVLAFLMLYYPLLMLLAIISDLLYPI